MADRIRTQLLDVDTKTIARLNGHHPDMPLVASGQLLDPTYASAHIFNYESWQDELWDYLDTIGEFGFAHWWLSQAIGRVRLIAAEKIPGQSEPRPLDKGPAAEHMAKISTSEIMGAFGLHIPLVGKAFLVGVEKPLLGEEWSVRSADEIRPTGKGTFDQMLGMLRSARKRTGATGRRDVFQQQVAEGKWVTLENALVSEVKRDNPRYGWKSASASKSAIPILREISLYDRHIIATVVSRLAMNGILLFPSEMTFPARKEFKDAPDPFIAEFVDHGSKSIKNPGTAGAALPFPMKVSSQFIDKIKHLPFASSLDERIIEARKEAVSRLATTINVSRERIVGMGTVNHWGQWEIKDDEISMHIVPVVELIVNALTPNYLHAMLLADGQKLTTPAGNPIIAWYDTGELSAQPDLSQNAQSAYDAGLLSREAYIRYLGFEPEDMPTDDELATIILLRQALGPQFSKAVFTELTGKQLSVPAGPQQASAPAGTEPPAAPPADEPPAAPAGDVRQPDMPEPAAVPGRGAR